MATTLLSVEEVEAAWQWTLTNTSRRPSQPNHRVCTYDHKVFAERPLNYQDHVAVDNVGRLYLISQLGDEHAIMEMVNGGPCEALIYCRAQLDRDVQVVVRSEDRFRNHLSEHLAFWVRLATAAQTLPEGRFMCPKPNYQPEDKGPDGLFVLNGVVSQIEPQSVKNSINSPRSLIASASFRRTGHVNTEQQNYRPKQLEEFYLAHHEWGFGRMDRLLAHMVLLLGMTEREEERSALIMECSYDAVVVADDQHANGDLFDGYQHVTPDINHRFATYIGADDWRMFAEQVRRFVCDQMTAVGVM